MNAAARLTTPTGRWAVLDVGRMAEIDPTGPALEGLLRAARRLAALAERLDEFRGTPLSGDERDTRDQLLREQRETRSRFEHLKVSLRRTLRSLAATASV